MNNVNETKTEQPTVCLDCGQTTLGFKINFRTTTSLDAMYALGLCPTCGPKADDAGATVEGWTAYRLLQMARNAKVYEDEFFAMKRRRAAAALAK